MKLKVLVDNNTYIRHYYYGESGLSFYIEDDGKKILFDTGHSDLFIRNAKAFQIDLNEIDDIVISHGHDDHTNGLKHLFEQFDLPDVRLTAHLNTFQEKRENGESIGSPLRAEQLRSRAKLTLTEKPVSITDNIVFLGEIPSLNNFEKRKSLGEVKLNDAFIEDFIFDDSALAYKSDHGIYIITGCSHSGICNIIEYSKQVCGDDRIAGVIGGFHLLEVDERLEHVIDYFVKNNISELYPCHCVAFKVKAEIHKQLPVNEVGVSLGLEW